MLPGLGLRGLFIIHLLFPAVWNAALLLVRAVEKCTDGNSFMRSADFPADAAERNALFAGMRN
ncbi:MAG: hypothetical protein OHK006_14450 [Thermodesulfovibrionales bacterium]